MEIIERQGKRFTILPDAPDTLVPIDGKWERDLIAEGMHPDNALDLAVEAPFRVIWGIGCFENFGSVEAALTRCNELSDGWGEEICSPYVAANDPSSHRPTIHHPAHGKLYAESIATREAVAA